MRTAAAALLLLGLLPCGVFAQEKSLHWSELAVRARLDSAGVLHVEERQAMVFTGDWNGGERSFNLRLGQHLDLQRLARIDPVTGEARALAAGGLDRVDQYAWANSSTLRWRSRLPSDPPFDQTAITYVLDYTLSGALEKSGGLYHLWSDFAFPDRAGEIERFTLDLGFDPVWRPVASVPGHLERQHLRPGESVLVKADLAFQGPGEDRLTGIRAVTPAPLRATFFGGSLIAMLLLYALFRRREKELGRFSPPETPAAWDEAWLRENVFLYLPEEVGALWDRKVGSPEVAAVLARLVGEGKLGSEVRSSRSFFGGKDVLHLTLKCPLSELVDYERKLVDGLFFGGRTETDTEAVRKHYQGSGFDPSSILRKPLESRLSRHAELQGSRPLGGGRRTFGLFLAGLALFGLDALSGWRQSLALLAVVLFATLWFYIGGLIVAFAWRQRTQSLDAASLGFLLPGLGIFGLCVLASFIGDWFPVRFVRPGLWGDLALALLPIAAWSSLLNNARSRETAAALHRRQLLAAARRILRGELDRRDPRLRDEWLPYLLAFGLQHDMDRWFRAFGATGASSAVAAGGFRAGSSTGSSSGGGGWTGGGGSFGGAGSSASWAAAATGLAAGVSAPSSSGGGGGGGGGGSSGGGGGGGW